ncbi:MAG: insulinase family protein [Bacteroidaceae bacterium]|nr:insulinase family protein [Bacteroidaceae bacterium]
MRIICAPSPSQVVYCGVAVDAGTRDELPSESGMAHFTEHMSFKGTKHRSSLQIINRLDSVGGDLNAYTGKEETLYYCAIARDHAARAIELLLDITLRSLYPQREMDKEAEVVVEEIESYNDSPSELIFDEFEQLIFPDHPLGRTILGDAERLRQLTTADMQAFARRLYRPERMVLYAYGDISLKRMVALASRHTAASQPMELVQRAPFALPPLTASETTQEKNTHQAHVVLGTRAFSATDTHNLHLHLLNNILGGPAMNSRFNLSLRERHGLVYTVESSQTSYTDTGFWNVYFGCDPSDIKRCLRLVRRELQRLTDAPLSPSALAAAKRQLKGQICLSFDNGENVAIGMAKRYLHYGITMTAEQLCHRVDSLTAQVLWDTAQQVFAPERQVMLMYK